MIYRETLAISKKEADFINEALTFQPKGMGEMIMGEDDTVTNTVIFPDGMEMDVKLCGVQFEEDNDNRPWCEAVLFNSDGGEEAYSDVDDEYFGEWILEVEDNTYIVDVVLE